MNPGTLGVRIRRATWLCAAIALALLLLAAPAHAAFPGKNGKIAFVSNRDDPHPDTCGTSGNPPCNREIYTMNADGTAVTRLTNNPAADSEPAWSPDGTKIAFVSNRDPSNPNCDDFSIPCNTEIYVMNADGTGQTRLTYTIDQAEHQPTWTPDGKKITFASLAFCDSSACSEDLATINADGTGETGQPGGENAGAEQSASEPAWSPNGQKLADQVYDWGGFTFGCQLGCGKLYTINADGTDPAPFWGPGNPPPDDPSWSPDGRTIAFTTYDFGPGRIAKLNLDRTGGAFLASGDNPAWAPDGTKIAFTSYANNYRISVMNADGSGATALTNGTDASYEPDWQPLPINYYPRPKGATPFQTYLTVAYKPCTSANEQHGAPLSSNSCSPPQQTSDYLTVGTLDSNGQKANAIGSVRYDVKVGSLVVPADVKIAISVTDVRKKSDLSDYTGELLDTATRRITDKNNTPAPDGTTEAATVEDIPFSATIPCAGTTDTTIGSTCALTTTANTLVPGQVTQNVRAIWQLDQVKLYDGGADGVASTQDNTLFMDEGVFVP